MIFDEDMDDRQVGMPVYLCEECGRSTVSGTVCPGCSEAKRKDIPEPFFYMSFCNPMSLDEIADRCELPRKHVKDILSSAIHEGSKCGVHVVDHGYERYSLKGKGVSIFPRGYSAYIRKGLWHVEIIDKNDVVEAKVRASGESGAIRFLVQKTWGKSAFFVETDRGMDGSRGFVGKSWRGLSWRNVVGRVVVRAKMLKNKEDSEMDFKYTHVVNILNEDGEVKETFRLMSVESDEGGASLYTRREWSSASSSDWTMDNNGEVFFQGNKAGFYRPGFQVEVRKIERRK